MRLAFDFPPLNIQYRATMSMKPKSSVNLGTFLRLRREELGLSQGHVAKKMGLQTSQYVSNWERGVSLPPIFHPTSIRKVVKIYELDLHDYVERIFQEQKSRMYKRLRERQPF